MDFQKTESHLEGEQFQVPSLERVKIIREREDDDPQELLPYQIVLAGAPFRLSLIEYRIITFLASRPYHPFTPEKIVEGVNRNQSEPLLEIDSLPTHVRTLRDKLGFFHDYVQKVPYIGYRFKP